MPDYPELAETLLRLSGHKSGRKIAEMAGVSNTYISRILKGKRPSYDILQKIAAGLKLSQDEARELFRSARFEVAAQRAVTQAIREMLGSLENPLEAWTPPAGASDSEGLRKGTVTLSDDGNIIDRRRKAEPHVDNFARVFRGLAGDLSITELYELTGIARQNLKHMWDGWVPNRNDLEAVVRGLSLTTAQAEELFLAAGMEVTTPGSLLYRLAGELAAVAGVSWIPVPVQQIQGLPELSRAQVEDLIRASGDVLLSNDAESRSRMLVEDLAGLGTSWVAYDPTHNLYWPFPFQIPSSAMFHTPFALGKRWDDVFLAGADLRLTKSQTSSPTAQIATELNELMEVPDIPIQLTPGWYYATLIAHVRSSEYFWIRYGSLFEWAKRNGFEPPSLESLSYARFLWHSEIERVVQGARRSLLTGVPQVHSDETTLIAEEIERLAGPDHSRL